MIEGANMNFGIFPGWKLDSGDWRFGVLVFGEDSAPGRMMFGFETGEDGKPGWKAQACENVR